jgi:CrcB protein
MLWQMMRWPTKSSPTPKLREPLMSKWMQLWAIVAERSDWRAPIAIALGAVPGALARYYLSAACTHWWGSGWPIGTAIVNLSGALLMGMFAGWASSFPGGIAPELRLLFAVGFLGSYTTFSTYMLDTAWLARSSSLFSTLAYSLGSLVLGLAALEAGRWLANRWL